MELTLLMKSMLGLVMILGILVCILLLPTKSKQKKQEIVEENLEDSEMDDANFDDLRNIIKDKKSSTQELESALDLIIKRHGTMRKKLGVRAHPDSDVYMDIMFRICRHPNTNKKIILKYNHDLEKLNPTYAKEINDALMRGLNSRGF